MLTVEFGVSSNKTYISIGDCYQNIGRRNALALPFFHSFTGSDSTSYFFKKGKVALFRAWQNFAFKETLTKVFIALSWHPSNALADKAFTILQKFVISAYGGKQLEHGLNDFRLQLFKKASSNNLRELPPSQQGLNLHIKRSIYQSGWIWGNSITQRAIPPATEFGWFNTGDNLAILWTLGSSGDLLKKITKTCGCRSGPNKSCKSCVCGKANLECLDQCKCQRSCCK